MRDYVAPNMEIELFDAHSDIILTSGLGSDSDWEHDNEPF